MSEQGEILTQLALHSAALTAHVENEVEWQTATTEQISNIEEAIHGNGKPGMRLQIDRLEQIESFRGRLLWLMVGAVIVIVATEIASRLG